MKPTLLTLITFILCLLENASAFHLPLFYRTDVACTALTCTTSNGINVVSASSNNISSVQMTQIDSISLSLLTGNQCSITLDSMLVNGAAVNYVAFNTGSFPSRHFRFISQPGTYHIYAKVGGIYPHHLSFTLLLSPVGLTRITKDDEERILLYPNPVQNRLNVTSKKSEIRSIRIVDSIGRLVGSYDVHQFQYQVPMEKHPAGMYFIYVTTESEKIEIKKVTVL